VGACTPRSVQHCLPSLNCDPGTSDHLDQCFAPAVLHQSKSIKPPHVVSSVLFSLSRPIPQASYMVLDQGISPVTFSVGNTMKRVAVVVSSVMFFKNPVSAMNWVSGDHVLCSVCDQLRCPVAPE
jgi:hypothetical protein